MFGRNKCLICDKCDLNNRINAGTRIYNLFCERHFKLFLTNTLDNSPETLLAFTKEQKIKESVNVWKK